MALPSSGTMKASMIREELKETGTWSINAKSSRDLAKVPSGMIKFSDFYGKSSAILSSYIIPEIYYNNDCGYSENNFGGIGYDTFTCQNGETFRITEMFVHLTNEVSVVMYNTGATGSGDTYPKQVEFVLAGVNCLVTAAYDTIRGEVMYIQNAADTTGVLFDILVSKQREKVPYSIISCSGTYGGGK